MESRNRERSAGNADLEAACRLWMAASAAKDERIAELEAEVNVLRQRVARLSRNLHRGQQPAQRSLVRFAR
jgi:uncharacterized protein YceH (UPF0502 family)